MWERRAIGDGDEALPIFHAAVALQQDPWTAIHAARGVTLVAGALPDEQIRVGETSIILAQIESLGYAVSVHRVNGVAEMHAVKLADPSEQHVSRVVDGDGPDKSCRYRRTNHDNLHVRGYMEDGTTTTPCDMVVLNDLDRIHLVGDVVDRVPGRNPLHSCSRALSGC